MKLDVAGLKQLTLGEIQAEETALLGEFARICEENGLRYWIAYGTCLGAVRHGGPIPWDDDVDVCMPAGDYERLMAMLPGGDVGMLLDREDDDYLWPYGKYVSRRTYFEVPHWRNYPADYGVFIDVFPLYETSRQDYFKRYADAQRIQRPFHWGYFWKGKGRGIKSLAKRAASVAARARPQKWYKDRIDSILNRANSRGDNDHLANYLLPGDREKLIFDKKFFEGFELHEYAGSVYRTPAHVEEYLEHVYGASWRTPIRYDDASHGEAYWRG